MATPAYPSYRDRPPKLVAGTRCLDFLNTVEWRGDPTARSERLTSYHEFIQWALHAGVLSAREAKRTEATASQGSQAAASALNDALAVREAMHRLVTQGKRDGSSLALLNSLLGRARFGFRLVAVDGALVRKIESDPLRLPLDRLLLEATDFLTSGERDRVSRCRNDRCGWVFLDTSRNRSRRWCSMAACGNTAKVHAHRQRKRQRSRPTTRH